MWIFKWAFRFPTCTQTGAQKGPLGTWLLPNPLSQEIMNFPDSQMGRTPSLMEAQGPSSGREMQHSLQVGLPFRGPS